MKRRPRLLFTSPLPPPPGGIATWTQAVLQSDLQQAFDLDIVNTALDEETSVTGASRFRLDRALHALLLVTRLCGRLLRFRPDVIHVNTPFRWALWRDGLFVWLGSLAGASTVLHFRGGDFSRTLPESGPLYRVFARSVLRRADRLIALDQETARFLREQVAGDSVRYLPNFVRIEEFGAPPRRDERASTRVEILFVGWLVAEKGVVELLEAFSSLPRARLTLAGPADPAFLARLEPQTRALGDALRVLPSQPKPEIRRLYEEADVFVLPTWREGFPNVVLEAMAAGLPIVATPVGAIPDAVRDGREGLLVPPREPAALGTALRRLVEDRELRLALGRHARERVEECFSMPAVVGALVNIYRELGAGST